MYSSMIMYRELNPNFDRAAYLTILHNTKLRNALSKLRLSSRRLAVETGRHTGVERQNRKCIFCVTDDLEDEYHSVLICPRYNNLRTLLIRQYYYRNPSMLKFIQLLNTSGKVLKLALYISHEGIWRTKSGIERNCIKSLKSLRSNQSHIYHAVFVFIFM